MMWLAFIFVLILAAGTRPGCDPKDPATERDRIDQAEDPPKADDE